MDPLGPLAGCEDYFDEEPGPEIEVGIVNMRAEPVLLLAPHTCLGNRFTVSGAPGDRAAHWPACGAELQTCGTLTGVNGCRLACSAPYAVRIEPGGRYALAWAPIVGVETVLPAGCGIDRGSPQPCMLGRRPVPGVYTVTIGWASADACTGSCACAAGEAWCYLDEATIDEGGGPSGF